MSLSTDVASIVSSCRDALARGGELRGERLRLIIDTLETLANTTESKASAAAVALEAQLVTSMAAWNAAGAGDSSADYTTAAAALAPLRTAAVSAAAASVTDVTPDDSLDGRTV